MTHIQHVPSPSTYHYTIGGRNFVKASRLGLSLVVGISLLVGVIEDVKGVVIHVVASKDVGDKLQERGLSDTGLSNEKDGVGLVL